MRLQLGYSIPSSERIPLTVLAIQEMIAVGSGWKAIPSNSEMFLIVLHHWQR